MAAPPVALRNFGLHLFRLLNGFKQRLSDERRYDRRQNNNGLRDYDHLVAFLSNVSKAILMAFTMDWPLLSEYSV